MGLLDFNFDDPDMRQGLLSAGAAMMKASGNRRVPISFIEGLGEGLSQGMQGYQQSDLLRRKKEEDDLARQMEQMKMQEYQRQIQQEDMARKQMAQRKAMMPQILQRYGNNLGAAVRDGVLTLEEAKGFAESQNIGRPKVARTQEVTGNDGQKMLRSFSEYNDVVGEDQRGYVAPQLVNTGDSQRFVTPMAGQSFTMGMSPADKAAAFRADRAYNQSERQFAGTQDLKRQELGVKQAEKVEAKNQAASNQVSSIDTMLDSLDRLKTHPGLKNSVGFMSVAPTMPGSDSANFQAELDTFQSQAFIPMVSQLKGMGALSDAEGKKLTAAVGALNPRMSEKAFKESLTRIKTDIEAARQRAIQGTTLPTRKQNNDSDIESLLKQYGG